MDANQPGLFDLPDRARQDAPDRRLRGRNRERWARTATAEVSIIDAGVLLEAAARAEQSALTTVLRLDPDFADSRAQVPGLAPARTAFNALGWLIRPTSGMRMLVESGALRVLTADFEFVAESVDRGTVTWTVTAKLIDVVELRRLAAQAHPNAAGLIADSLAAAWQHAADAFAPLRTILGIAWRPGPVVVEHRPARSGRNR